MATALSRRSRRHDEDERPASKYRSKRVDDDIDDDDDDDEVESPRARRRRDRDADPEPRRGRSRDRDEDDDDDEDDDEEEERPRSRRSSRSSKPSRSSRRDDDEDEDDEDDEDEDDDYDDDDDDDEDDDEPRARRKSSGGWKEFNKKRKRMGNFANELKVPDDEQVLIKFLDDEPFATFGQHWVETSNGRRSYICLEDKCPLCDKLGDSPKAVGAFNILQLEEDIEPKLMVWACGPSIMSLLEKKAAARTGPLSKEYYAVSKGIAGGGKKGFTQYQVDVVRSRDLKEEWNVRPLPESALDKHAEKAMTEEKYVRMATRKELMAVARELMDDDD